MNAVSVNRKILCDIAHFAFEIVNDWLARDQLLALELRSSETSSRQIVGEEAITVDLATKLLSRFPQHVDLTLFTHPEETRTGADWYWRVERGNHAIHARVQTKRVQRTEFGESDALGHIDIDSPQLERLLQATHIAAQSIVGLEAWLATYARFSATPPCGYDNLLSCRQHHHAEACTNGQPSLWIAHAQEIANSRIRQASIEQIVQHSVRLDCVLPCIDASGASGPSKKGFVLQSGLQSYQECVATIESDPQLRSGFRGALRIHQI
jgi:hypothetical protein